MAEIVQVEREHWTVFRVIGDATTGDVGAAFEKYYPHLRTPKVIWDFSEGSMDTITREDLATIARHSKSARSDCGARRTAFVGPTSSVFALLCMYSCVAYLEDVQGEYSAFQTLAEAERWLGER